MECNNCGRRGYRGNVNWKKKGKQKDDEVDNIFVGATFCVEVQKENHKEDHEEWLGDSRASLHINQSKNATSMQRWEMVRR